jgi:hypothetical protein
MLNSSENTESSVDVKNNTQMMSTIARMSHPTDIATGAAVAEKMPTWTPFTAKTMAIAPNMDSWRRCTAIASVATARMNPTFNAP